MKHNTIHLHNKYQCINEMSQSRVINQPVYPYALCFLSVYFSDSPETYQVGREMSDKSVICK